MVSFVGFDCAFGYVVLLGCLASLCVEVFVGGELERRR